MATTKKNTKNSSKKKSTSKKKTPTKRTSTTNKKTNTSKKTNTTPKKKSSTSTKKSVSNKKSSSSKKPSSTTSITKKTPKKTTSNGTKKVNNNAKKSTYNKEKEPKASNIFIYVCKQVLILLKNLRNFIIKQYNKIRRRIKSKNLENKKKGEEITIELNLLHYKDYKGLKKIKVFFINRIRVIKFDMKRFGKKFKYGTLKDKILIILMCGLIAVFSLMIVVVVYVIATAPEVTEKKLYKSSATVLYDINGNEFARLGKQNRDRISYDDLPQVLIDAIVATEDSRFFQHNGIDIARFTKATIGQLLGHADAGGGSTLTMQVSKNAATSTTRTGLAGIIRKLTDIYLSVFVLEKKYTKEQIMEFYVNIPDLSSHAFGVEQASQTYFGKSVTDLTLSEAAILAGMFQAPTSYNPFYNPELTTKRRSTVLNLMYRHGYITEEERDAANAIPVTSLLTEKGSNDLPENLGYIDTVVWDVKNKLKEAYGGDEDDYSPDILSMNVYTTFDPERQQVINDIYSGKTYKWKNDVAQAGIAVVDVHDGSLVAVGAGRNKKNQRGWNVAIDYRHPGSTAKPVLDYGPAIEYLNWGTGQTIIDDKMTYTGGASIKNFDNGYKGIMTIKQALAQSRNIPALFTFQQTTNEQKYEFATNLGWDHLEASDGQLLESSSIGGFKGVSPIQSAAAFATFARGGTYIEPYTFTKIEFTDTNEVYEHVPKKVQAMSEETAYIITMILRYAVTSGVIGPGSVKGTDIAAKTGTSTVGAAAKKALGVKGGMIGDSWEVAFSPDYAISLWYGYKNNTKEYHLTGSEGGKARRTLTKILTKGIMKKNSRFKRPSGVTTVEIELETDPVQLASEFTPKELRSSEIFKKGHAPSQTSERFSKLAAPSNLSYSSTSNSVTLSWTPAATPNAVNQEYLTDFFNKSNVYKKWSEKYLKQRLDYNNANIGLFGYEVYLKNQMGTYDLGFTTNTSFTTNVQFDATTTFIVKSSYQKFKANQSDGVSVSVAPNSTVNNIPQQQTTTTTAPSKLSITYLGPSCSTVDDFKALGSNPRDKILVKENGVDVTNNANVSIDCFLASDPDTGGQCNNLISGKEYIVNITVSYKKTNRTKIINLKRSC